MNLKESIIRILKEETSLPLHLRRRVNIDELHHLFNEILDQQAFMMSLISNPNNKTLNRFKRKVIMLLMDSIHGELSNWGSTDFDYDGIYDDLTDYFLPQIKKKYDEVIESNNNPTEQELDEYARTLKNARRQGAGLRFPKSAVKANPSRFRKYSREKVNESDPKTGTGKKPEGSGRRLYTDENPNDTVSVKFRTKEDIVDTLNKDSFKSKPHKRQSQIINLIHQRVRAAYQNAKDSETKQRLKRAYDYIEIVKEKSKEKTIRLQKQEQTESEITERCWKGYTQKGMKTMFGKRYPNCVKINKK